MRYTPFMTTPIALQTAYGQIVQADSLAYRRDEMADESVDLIFTSPPFALLRKKDYGNVEEDKYSKKFQTDNGGAIPPNLLAIPNEDTLPADGGRTRPEFSL